MYQDNKLLATLVYFADPVQTSLWSVWAKQHAKDTSFPVQTRPARKETNVPLHKRSQEVTILSITYILWSRLESES